VQLLAVAGHGLALDRPLGVLRAHAGARQVAGEGPRGADCKRIF
jgi:hypothetical protein